MDNLTAVKSLCNAICSTFYPDDKAVMMLLFNQGIAENADATPNDPRIFRIAVSLVKGYVEGNRSEGGISMSVRSEDAIKRSLMHWCKEYGLDPAVELSDFSTVIENCSNLW